MQLKTRFKKKKNRAVKSVLRRCFSFFPLSVNAQCEFASPDGDYKASWYLDSATQIVHFKLSAKQRQPGGFWTGIGFGGKMVQYKNHILHTPEMNHIWSTFSKAVTS